MAEINPITARSNDICGRCKDHELRPRATSVIAGIEAVHMIRKGQVLGITKNNLRGQAWVFGARLGLE